jgi:hypothetical protein
MKRINVVRIAMAAALVPSLAGAQVFTVGGSDDREIGPRRSPVFGGASIVYGRPSGAFADYVEQGFGVDGFGRWKVDRRGVFSLGLEGGWLQYGRETKRVPLSSTIGRVEVDVTTSNNIIFLGAGPQLMAPSGALRPYINGSAGFSYLFTESSVDGDDRDYGYGNDGSFAKSTNYSDFVFATTGGAGVYIPFGAQRRAGLDIGVRYHNSGRGKYLKEGSIVDRPGTTPLIFPIESETHLLSWRIGFVTGLR